MAECDNCSADVEELHETTVSGEKEHICSYCYHFLRLREAETQNLANAMNLLEKRIFDRIEKAIDKSIKEIINVSAV